MDKNEIIADKIATEYIDINGKKIKFTSEQKEVLASALDSPLINEGGNKMTISAEDMMAFNSEIAEQGINLSDLKEDEFVQLYIKGYYIIYINKMFIKMRADEWKNLLRGIDYKIKKTLEEKYRKEAKFKEEASCEVEALKKNLQRKEDFIETQQKIINCTIEITKVIKQDYETEQKRADLLEIENAKLKERLEELE